MQEINDFPGISRALEDAHELLHLSRWLEKIETDMIRAKNGGALDEDSEFTMIGVRMFNVLIDFVERFDNNFKMWANPYYDWRPGGGSHTQY